MAGRGTAVVCQQHRHRLATWDAAWPAERRSAHHFACAVPLRTSRACGGFPVVVRNQLHKVDPLRRGDDGAAGSEGQSLPGDWQHRR